MEFSTDSERQQLIETHSEPFNCTREKYADFASERTEDTRGVDCQQQSSWLCQQTDSISGPESDAGRMARKKLCMACAVSFIFMTGEMIGGYAACSLAIMSDAAHLLIDFGSILMSLFSLWLSSRPPTHALTLGWLRAEILGMLLSVLSIWAVTVVLVISAIQRVIDGEYEIDSQIMLITSGCAVGVNILMFLILHGSGSSHSHSHSCHTGQMQEDDHQQQHNHHGSHSNASVRAAFIHVVGDLVQSVGVLIAATIIHFWPEYKVADPICTFLFSALVLWTTLPALKDVFRILMEGTPKYIHVDRVKKQLLSVRGVMDVHSLHVWSLNLMCSLLSVHVTSEEEADAQSIIMKATKLLRSKFGFSSITIQVERRNDSCQCFHCGASNNNL